MNAVDLLLKMDKAQVTELPTKQIEIERLSKLADEPFMVTVRAINGERMSEIQRNAVTLGKKGNMKDVNLYNMQTQIIMAGMVDPNLKDKDLLEAYGCTTPKDLVTKLFLAGEIADLSNDIQELSGYDRDSDDIEEEVKKQ